MKIPQFRSSANYTDFPLAKDLEAAVGISMTIPDMTMPLKELIERHTRGLPLPEFVPFFSEDEIPDIQKMDLAEIEQYKRELNSHIQYLQSQIEESQYEQVKNETFEDVTGTSDNAELENGLS